jgi:TolB-like protein/Flp pilus assembly protein TadD
MGVVNSSTLPGSREPAASERLDSWKEIAAYLKRDESTARRWEEEGLPVHRHPHKKKATVFAYKSELDVWWSAGRPGLETAATTIESRPSRSKIRWPMAATMVLVVVALALMVGVRQRVFGGPRVGEISSIAVLPLKNLSGDPTQDYFADGMTEALITELGKISALQVLSHQSVNGYRQTAKPIPEIARELRVGVLLEGTVLHSGSRVRITTNLVQAVPERHLWAESYEFDGQDVLAVQGEVARDVASRIRINVTPQEHARLTRSRRVDPDVYQAYLLGRAFLLQAATTNNWRRAKEYFDQAIAKDPAYGPAYASLAELYMRARGSPFRNPADLRRQARQWAEQALKLDDTLAEAHTALARAAQQEWDWVVAEREYRRAIDVNPSYPRARIWYAMYLYGMGRFDEAVVQAKRAQELDPASAYVNTWAAAAYLFGGRSDEGNAFLQKALELDPRYTDANIIRARTYVARGMYDPAVAELQSAVGLTKQRQPLLLGALAHAYARAGRREEALQLVEELRRIETDAGEEYVPPFGLIWAYAGLGDNDQAFRWLEQAYTQGSDRIVWLNVEPLLDPLRADPRFDELVRRVGLPMKAPPRSR